MTCNHDHHHHHHHHQAFTSTDHAFTEANRQHYDEAEARKYDERPEAVELARKFAAVMKNAYAFDEQSTTLLDYACGTGLISRELAPYTKSIVAVDISQPMIDQFNIRIGNQGLTPDEIKAVCIDLKGQEGELDGAKFDVIVCALAYHHISSIQNVTRTLAFFLKPQGTLLIADIAKSDNSEHLFPDQYAHIVAHQAGFDEGDIRNAFDAAGLQLVKFETVATLKMHGKDISCFLAQGTKQELS